MTSVDFVKKYYPNAYVQSYKTHLPKYKHGHYICWSSHYQTKIFLAEGTSRVNVWENAMKKIQDSLDN